MKFAHSEHTIPLLEKCVLKLEGTMIPAQDIPKSTLGGKITRAVWHESDQHQARYLAVDGVIYPEDITAPDIEWRVLLPEKWNRRSVQIGGGANNGHIPDLEHAMLLSELSPVEHEFCVFSDDSGHQSEDCMSSDFAANAEALRNYIREHLLKVNQVMHYLVKLCYGADAQKVYYAGGSAGGREALECAMHYGKYYDGIFCACPASNFVLVRLWGAFLAKAVYDSYDPLVYPYSDGFIPEDVVKEIQRDAIDRYDELDGIKDGIVANIYEARAHRDEFRDYITEKYHLTQAQLVTIEVYEEGFCLDYSMPNGFHSHRGCSALEGGLMDLGPDPIPREPLDTKYNVHHGDRADGTFKYFIMKDKEWKLIDHDYRHPDENLKAHLMEAAAEYDVNGSDLDEFVEHGGKMILFTGWNDMSMSPWQLIQQYKGYVERYGKDRTDEFIHFYTMPGVTHCAGIAMDYLEWLDEWCTTGQYPSQQLYATIKKTGGQMPMAEFPGWVKYHGGDPLQGTSYEISREIPEGFFGKYD